MQTIVCIALAVFLSMSAIRIYREGSARKAEHPMENIYTPEEAGRQLAQAAPLFFAGVGLMIAGLVLDVTDEDEKKSRKDASSLMSEKSVLREIQAAQEQLKEEKTEKAEKADSLSSASVPVCPMRKKAVLQAAVIIAALVLIIAGAFNGSARDVLYKAITICTECIGLG